jgi:radical SAM protein with 4Fe4S-binding SPASM domain
MQSGAQTAPRYPSPRLVYWEITKRCNLRCAHCRAVPQDCASPEELSLTEGFRLIDGIAEAGAPILVLTGGEPLLRRDVFDLAAYGRSCGLRTALATNGTLVTRLLARRVVEAGFMRVSISLDGPDAETHDRFRRVPGAFDAAVDGFIHLKELGMSLQVNTTVTTGNRELLEETHELVRKLGADAWHLFLLVPVGCGLELDAETQLTPRAYEAVLWWIEELAAHKGMEIRATCAPHAQRVCLQRQVLQGVQGDHGIKGYGGKGSIDKSPSSTPLPPSPSTPQTRRGCLAGTGICFVSHRGEVFPCGYLPVRAGDIHEQSFAAIWDGSPVFAELRDPDRLSGKCGACEYRVVCGGCRARAYGYTHDYLAEEPLCLYLPQR